MTTRTTRTTTVPSNKTRAPPLHVTWAALTNPESSQTVRLFPPVASSLSQPPAFSKSKRTNHDPITDGSRTAAGAPAAATDRGRCARSPAVGLRGVSAPLAARRTYRARDRPRRATGGMADLAHRGAHRATGEVAYRGEALRGPSPRPVQHHLDAAAVGNRSSHRAARGVHRARASVDRKRAARRGGQGGAT